MKFKECLRRVIGRRSEIENLPTFKLYFQHSLKSAAISNGYPAHEQTDEYVERRTTEFIEWFKRDGVNKGFYEKFSAEIPAWRKEHRQRQQRINAANSRWLKKNRKKILTLLVQRISAAPHR